MNYSEFVKKTEAHFKKKESNEKNFNIGDDCWVLGKVKSVPDPSKNFTMSVGILEGINAVTVYLPHTMVKFYGEEKKEKISYGKWDVVLDFLTNTGFTPEDVIEIVLAKQERLAEIAIENLGTAE